MSRFEYAFEDNDGMVPFGLWQATLSRSLASRRGQEALAELEEALVNLPAPRLTEGHLVTDDGDVCAVGAYVAQRRAKAEGVTIAQAVAALTPDHNDPWGGDEDPWETAEAGRAAGLTYSVAWHLAYLNDEKWGGTTPEKRYEQMLAWVRRAQGKQEATAA